MWRSETGKALYVFKRLLKRYNEEPNHILMTIAGTNYWIRSIADTIERYIGPDSYLKQACSKLIEQHTESGIIINDDNFRPDLLLIECIEYIEINGVYKGKGNNFLGGLTNAELVPLLSTLLIAVCGGAFSIGFSLNYFNQKQVTEAKASNTQITTKVDSIKNIPIRPISTKSKSPSTALPSK